MVKTLGSKIKDYLKKTKKRQSQLAKEIDIGQSSLSLWISDTVTPSASSMKLLAKAMGCSVDSLMENGDSKIDNIQKNILNTPSLAETDDYFNIPFLTQLNTSKGSENLFSEITEKFILDKKFLQMVAGENELGNDLFVTICRGDSMSPTLNNGDLVLVKIMDAGGISDGEICFLRRDHSFLIRRIQKNPHTIFLPENQKYQPILPDRTTYLYGKVISVMPRFVLLS